MIVLLLAVHKNISECGESVDHGRSLSSSEGSLPLPFGPSQAAGSRRIHIQESFQSEAADAAEVIAPAATLPGNRTESG
jgi:hypothetical protein